MIKLKELFNESGLLYRAGVKKYGLEGMKKIQQAAGKRLSHAAIGKIKDKYEKDKKESVNEGPTPNDLMKELEKVNEIAIKILKKYEKSIGNYMPAVIQKWMYGLHKDIKKQGYRV